MEGCHLGSPLTSGSSRSKGGPAFLAPSSNCGLGPYLVEARNDEIRHPYLVEQAVGLSLGYNQALELDIAD